MKKTLKNYRKFVYKLRFSVELEAEFPEKVDIDILRTRYRKLLKSWTVVHDYSMNNGLEFKSKDYNKLYFKKECFDEISEILHIIRKRKGSVASKKCGLHVHIDAKKLTNEEIIKIVKEMMAKQHYMVRDFKVNADRLNHYCKYIKKAHLKGLTPKVLQDFRDKKQIKNVPYLQEKYYVLNVLSLLEHGSLEFRLFNGTKYLRDIKKIIKYIFEFLINALERESNV